MPSPMLRKLLALLIFVGLGTAGCDILTGNSSYLFNEPVELSGEQAATMHAYLEDQVPWVSRNTGGKPLYIIGFRSCPPCNRFKKEYLPRLEAKGVEARMFLYVPGSNEKFPAGKEAELAVIAELHKTRDWSLYEAWYAPGATAATLVETRGIAISEEDARANALAALDHVRTIKNAFETAARDQYPTVPLIGPHRELAIPLIIWQEGDKMVAMTGSTEETARIISTRMKLDWYVTPEEWEPGRSRAERH